MRFVMRLLGTWLLGLALILIIIDGTRSLASSGLVMSSLADAWAMLHAESLTRAGAWAERSGVAGLWGLVANSILAWPGFLVTGIPGLALAFAGRSRTTQISSYGQT